MKRTKKIKRSPSLIITGDWHLQENVPICRNDDFWTTQWNKVRFISTLQEKYKCPVIHGGDLFHHWKPSPYLLSATLKYLPNQFYTIYGNHDLPSHNFELYYKSGIEVLSQANKIGILSGTHWDLIPEQESFFFDSKKILVWHVMTYQGKQPWPGCFDPLAEKILEKYSGYSLIITSHNHETFVVEQGGQLLVNPGSMMRMAADQENHEPCVFLWYAETNEVVRVVLPHEKGVISREHIEAREEQGDSRYQAFIKGLQENAPQISFQTNLEEFFRQHSISRKIKEMVWKSVEE